MDHDRGIDPKLSAYVRKCGRREAGRKRVEVSAG